MNGVITDISREYAVASPADLFDQNHLGKDVTLCQVYRMQE